jgi:hypothetical protein
MSAPRPIADVVLHELPDGEHALSDGARGRMLVVNDVGAAVWLLLDGERDAAAIARTIAEDVDADEGTVRADVETFLEALRAHGFIG